ncbi:hypothetical protein CWC29_009930 [Pseudoalteromonas sp. S4498]|uniref:phosphoribosyltransferase-like protein n=1 Tax=Pseudoalteromonas galatheae TaxID=579562 RepID=UPI0011092452|nr:hypothetical protein [Pseudoalteromonas galatheae]NKC19156.1 hypothetical protein [Pseudoalteromonas galatheae]
MLDITLDEKSFKILFKLNEKQPWLNKKIDKVSNLIFKDCASDEQRKLVIDLLSRFTYISDLDFPKRIRAMADYITNLPGAEDSNTQILGMSANSDPDSADMILYNLKMPLQENGWTDHISSKNFNRSRKKFNDEGSQHVNIVLVDEFVGSGQTVLGRIKTLKNSYSDLLSKVTFKVVVVAASTVGKQAIHDADIEIHSLLDIDKGISEFYSNIEVDENLKLMKDLEKILAESYKDRQLPSLGYGETESLYTRENGNTPNSVFPIFWWPIYSDNSRRKPILTRAMQDA